MAEVGETQVATPEIPGEGWDTLIILQRHSAYNSGRPADRNSYTDEEKATLGRLTDDTEEKIGGKTLAAQKAEERIDAILANDPTRADFLVVSSPTFWLDEPQFGQRARETADIIIEQIKQELTKRGLSQDQILNTHPVPVSNEGKVPPRETRFRTESSVSGSTAKRETSLRESQMFQFPEYAAYLREKYGGQGPNFWKNRNLDTDREKREELGAPSPQQDANDVSMTVAAEARYARLWHQSPDNSGRRLVIWNITHGDGLEPYAQRIIGMDPSDFSAGYNDGFAISVNDQGSAKTIVSGKEFSVSLVPPRGNRLPPQK